MDGRQLALRDSKMLRTGCLDIEMRITWYSHSGISIIVCNAAVEGVWLAAN
jgi:hypothetical protein